MMLVSYLPVWDLSLIGKPANWGFFIFGKEKGFSWWWMLRLFLLFYSAFEFAMILSNKNKALSIVSAFWITLSPAVQWWYSSILVDVLYYSLIIIVALYRYLWHLY